MVVLGGTEAALWTIYEQEPGKGSRMLVGLIVVNSIFLIAGIIYFLFKFVLIKTTKVVGLRGSPSSVSIQPMCSQKLPKNDRNIQILLPLFYSKLPSMRT